VTILSSAYSSNHRAQKAEYRRFGYLANGWNKVRRWGGRTATLETAGITGPSRVLNSWTPSPTTAAGSCTPGFHVFRYRFMDSRTGYVSNPSEEREIEVVSGSQQLTFPIDTASAANMIRSTDTKVDRIILEMTVAGGSQFFTAASALNSATSIVASISDAALEQQFLGYTDDGHDPPPLAKNILSHRERIWLYGQVTHAIGTASFTNGSVNVAEGGSDPDWIAEALGSAAGESTTVWFIQKAGDTEAYEISHYDAGGSQIVLKAVYPGTTAADSAYVIFSRTTAVWVSNPAFPESYTPLKFLNSPNGENAGDVTAGVGYGSSVIFFTLNSMFKFAWDQDPLIDGFYTPLSAKAGALNQRTVIEVEGVVYSMDRRGWHAWTGVFPKLISRGVDPLARENVNYDNAENFHCCYFPETRSIRWFVSYGDDVYPKNYFQFDIDTAAWSTGTYRHGISDSRLIPTAEGLRVIYGDENGHRWFADEGTCDGCPADFSHPTVQGAATSTSIPVDLTLPTDGVGLAGCYLTRRLSSGITESRLITSNDAGNITVDPAFSSTPANGDLLWVGSFVSKLRTKAFHGPKVPDKKRSIYLSIMFQPTDEARFLQVRVYEDLSASAKTWVAATPRRIANRLPDLYKPGEDTTYPVTDWLVDLSADAGVVRIPLGPEFRRHFEFEFEIEEPDADFRLVALEHGGDVVEDTP
jgi:hypothetical protein